jgi:hypothetical protein
VAALLAEPDSLIPYVDVIEEETARAALRRVSGAARSHTGWNLSRESVTGWTGSADNGATLYLPTMWLVSVESVSLGGVTLAAGTYTTTRDGRLILARAYRTWGDVTVNFTHGYDPDSADMDNIRGIVAGAAARLLNNPEGLRSQTIGTETWTVAVAPMDDPNAALSSGEKYELSPYVLPRLG